jgi:hypothetical protein
MFVSLFNVVRQDAVFEVRIFPFSSFYFSPPHRWAIFEAFLS